MPPEDLPDRWQENLFFILWDDAPNGADSGLLVHLQRVPARDFQEARVVLVVEGEVASATLAGAYGPALLPGLRFEAAVPFTEWHVLVDAALNGGRGPLGLLAMHGPGATEVHVEATLRSELPVVDFADALDAVVGAMQADRSGPQMGRQEHYEQGGTWEGVLRMGEHEVRGRGLFVRDHSWGIRHEHNDFTAFWTASCLDGGRVFANAIGIPRSDGVVGIGAVAGPDGVRFTSDVGATFSPAAGIGSYDRTAVRFGAGVDAVLTAETVRHVPILLPHSGPGRYDNNAVSRVAMGGARGFGVMEWAAVLADEEVAALPEGAAHV